MNEHIESKFPEAYMTAKKSAICSERVLKKNLMRWKSGIWQHIERIYSEEIKA